jgi:uncharacterized protein
MLIQQLKSRIKSSFSHLEGSHDWQHIERVYNMAKYIAKREPAADIEIVEALALVHDISDHKLNGGILNNGKTVALPLLLEIGFAQEFSEKVASLVDEISFKGAGVLDQTSCIESQIIQDADRLDAIGAIGIARAFAYGGSKQRALYIPENKPTLHQSFEEYTSDQGHTVNHFYEKLLLLKDRMHTETGRKLANERHDFMLTFLKQFKEEWFWGEKV